MELDFELTCCPECGEPLLDDLRDFATESREYEGPFGHVCQWTFRDVELECPGCGADLLLNGTIVEEAGANDQDLTVTLNQN